MRKQRLHWLVLPLLLTAAAPPKDLPRHQCDLDGLADGKLVLDEEGIVWLLNGSKVVAEVATELQMWPDRTLVRCSGTVAEVYSQGERGQLELNSLELDFADFL